MGDEIWLKSGNVTANARFAAWTYLAKKRLDEGEWLKTSIQRRGIDVVMVLPTKKVDTDS